MEDTNKIRLAISADDSKHAFLLRCIPSWRSWRPLSVLGRNTATSLCTRKILTSETSLEVETGRYLRVDRSLRFCDRCLDDGIMVMGDEEHSLSLDCGRAHGAKQELFMDLMWLLDVAGVDVSNVMDLPELIYKSQGVKSEKEYNMAWIMISKVMKAIERELSG